MMILWRKYHKLLLNEPICNLNFLKLPAIYLRNNWLSINKIQLIGYNIIDSMCARCANCTPKVGAKTTLKNQNDIFNCNLCTLLKRKQESTDEMA